MGLLGESSLDENADRALWHWLQVQESIAYDIRLHI